MNTARITKIEKSDDLYFVTLKTEGDLYAEFDAEQLAFDGENWGEISIQNSDTFGSEILITVSGEMGLKVGDSITDEAGGLPILGTVRGEAEQYQPLKRLTPSLEEVYCEKHGLRY
jgi:hypothetical protein